MKHKDNLFQLEALAFGQAGFLNSDFSDEYPGKLKNEYQFLAQKYNLQPIEFTLWKFLRLRPSSFPTIRIAQWAVFLQKLHELFSLSVGSVTIDDLVSVLSVNASGYWNRHYQFDKLSGDKIKRMGNSTICLLIINFVIPFLFVYGEEKGVSSFKEKSIALLEQIPPEENSVVSQWKNLGLPAGNALKTQALIQLKVDYCDHKRCLNCRIGNKLLKGSRQDVTR